MQGVTFYVVAFLWMSLFLVSYLNKKLIFKTIDQVHD